VELLDEEPPEFLEPAEVAEPAAPVPEPEKRRPAAPKPPKPVPAPAAKPVPAPKPAATPGAGEAATDIARTTQLVKGPLRGVDLTIRSHQLTAILGLPHAGLTDLLNCLAGLDTVESGTIVVNGLTVTGLAEKQRTAYRRDHVGLVFPSYNLLPHLTVIDNLRVPLVIKKKPFDQAWYEQVVAALRIGDTLTLKPDKLGRGQQQRAAFARAAMAKPALILADEPTADLDSEASTALMAAIRASVDELKQSVVYTTTDPGVAALADRVVVLRDGLVADDITAPTVSRLGDALRTPGGGRS
jgi:putative ABC transport system ATP-binding protein